MIRSEIQAFLSIVIAVHNEASHLEKIIDDIEQIASRLVSDYEIVIVDNGSVDETISTLQAFTSEEGRANLQIYSLAGQVDDLTASWVGIENSIGDIVICLSPINGDVEHLEELTRKAASGYDIVFTRRLFPGGRKRYLTLILYKIFGAVSKFSTGIDLDSYSSSLVAISRRTLNYLLQFPNPQIKFRNLPSTTGFSRSLISFTGNKRNATDINLRQSLSRGVQLITSSTGNPMRVATTLSAFGAMTSFLYSLYIVLIWAFKKDIAPGWVSLSLQQSGMFFLISVVLLVLSEYVLEISRKVNSGPAYYISNEFTSAKLNRKTRLNVEVNKLIPETNSNSLF